MSTEKSQLKIADFDTFEAYKKAVLDEVLAKATKKAEQQWKEKTNKKLFNLHLKYGFSTPEALAAAIHAASDANKSRGNRFTPEQKQEMIEMAKAGKKAPSIAKELKLHAASVYYVLKNEGLVDSDTAEPSGKAGKHKGNE